MSIRSKFALISSSYHKQLSFSSEYSCVFKNENSGYNILTELTRPAGAPWIIVPLENQHRQHRERKQKQGCQAGIHARLRKNPHKPLLPSLFMMNARSLANKMGELEMITNTQKNLKDSCVMIITET